MAFQIPFPLPSHGTALNSKVRINLDAVATAINGILTGTTSYDTLTLGTANSITGTLTFYNSGNAHPISFQPGTTAADITYTLPAAIPTNNVSGEQFLMGTYPHTMHWSGFEWNLGSSDTGILYANVITGNQFISRAVNTLGDRGFVTVNTSGIPTISSLLGTSNQIIVTTSGSGTFNVTLSTPQNINTSADVQFGTLVLQNGSLGSEAIKLGSGLGVVGIYNTGSSEIGFSIASTYKAKIDGGGNITATGNFYGQGLQLEETGAGTHTATIQAPATLSANYTLTLPVDDGTSNQVLTTDGSGVLSWTTPASAGANTALSNLASVAINTPLLPAGAFNNDLGSTSKQWAFVYAQDGVFGTSGTAGSVAIFPSTSSKGKLLFNAVANSGDTITTITNAAQAGARTYTIPDSGASASFVMTEGTQTINGSKTMGSALAMGSHKITGLSNGTASDDAAAFGQIKYIQAPQQGTKTASFTTTSSTYQATGLTATITPTSSSNRIKVTVSIAALDSANSSAAFAYVTVKRGSTDIAPGTGFMCNASNSSGLQYICSGSFSYIDSPATTSATTYEVYLKNDNNSTTVRINGVATSSVIILEEIV